MPNNIDSLNYESVLRGHARKSMLWVSLFGAAGLGLISLGSAKIDLLSGLVYLPLLLVMLVSLIALLSNTNSESNLFRYLADVYALCAMLGATLLVIRADMIGFVIKTSPIQYAAMLSLAFCFHRRRFGIIRNIILILISIICLSYYSLSLTISLYLHYIFGFFAGSIVHFISEDRMYKDFLYKQTMERERMENSRRMRHLHSELRSRCLPHQIELIYNGHHYRETMPVYRSNFWVSCFNLLPLSEASGDLSQKQLLQVLSQEVREKYQSEFAPVRTNSAGLGQSAIAMQNQGFYIRSDEASFYVSYDYPFPFSSHQNKGTTILRSILKQLQMFHEIVALNKEYDFVTAIVSLVYDSGVGVFTGSLSNYEIEGRVFTLAERYQKTRYQIEDINEKLRNGFLAIVLSATAFQKIRKELPHDLKSLFIEYQVKPHVRDDKDGKSVYTCFIRKDELPHFLELTQRAASPHLRLVA